MNYPLFIPAFSCIHSFMLFLLLLSFSTSYFYICQNMWRGSGTWEALIQFTEFSIHSLNGTCYFWLAKRWRMESQYSWMERWMEKKVEESIFRKMAQRIKSINDNSNGTFPSQCAFDSYRWVLVWLSAFSLFLSIHSFLPIKMPHFTLIHSVNRYQFIYPECTCFNLCIFRINSVDVELHKLYIDTALHGNGRADAYTEYKLSAFIKY